MSQPPDCRAVALHRTPPGRCEGPHRRSFVYDTVSHLLGWDSNGAPVGGALVLALLQDGSCLAASDLQLIA